jgi:DNA-binding transcriptional MerR regulator
MQTKTTRAFRTISEAADELDLQPHVLRFWESKFSQIRPIKRAGGRRLYRAEDIDLLRGIKILLHEEKHPIKDVQKIIRLKGPNQVVELGRSIKQAAMPRDVTDTVLIPDRISSKKQSLAPSKTQAPSSLPQPESQPEPVAVNINAPISVIGDQPQHAIAPPDNIAPQQAPMIAPQPIESQPQSGEDHAAIPTEKLKAILSRLENLRREWDGVTLPPSE